jgi:hypothetical protein
MKTRTGRNEMSLRYEQNIRTEVVRFDCRAAPGESRADDEEVGFEYGSFHLQNHFSTQDKG